jgi:hypothetical protein
VAWLISTEDRASTWTKGTRSTGAGRCMVSDIGDLHAPVGTADAWERWTPFLPSPGACRPEAISPGLPALTAGVNGGARRPIADALTGSPEAGRKIAAKINQIGLQVTITRCVPVIDDSGTLPTAEEMDRGRADRRCPHCGITLQPVAGRSAL